MRILVDPERCAGCRLCEVICSFTKTNKFNPKRSMIRVFSHQEGGLSVPLVCANCDGAACIISCPAKAIQRDLKTAIPIVNMETCIGCGACIKACNYKAISWDLNGKTAQKCDLCQGDPACVKLCPTKAITYSDHPILEHLLEYIAVVT